MTTRAPAWFEAKFIAGAIHRLQSKGFLTKGMFASETGIKGSTVTWKLAGTGEAAPMVPGEIGNRPVLNAARDIVTATMEDWEANEYIGAVDPEKMTENEQQVAQQTIGMAIGRRFDRIPLSKIDAVNPTTLGLTTANVTVENVMEAQSQILSNGNSEDYDLYCLLPFKQLTALALTKAFSNADYVTDTPLMKKIGARRWNGVMYVPAPDSYFRVPAANQYDFYMWAKSCVGFATPTDEEGKIQAASRIDYVAEKKQYFAAQTMSAASEVLMIEGIRRFRVGSNIALASGL